MSFTRIISTLWNPAILVALVPFIRLIIEFVFRRAFKNSTTEALAHACDNTDQNVRTAVSHKDVREALALYVDNDSDLEEFFQTCLFSALSLVVWLLTAQSRESYQQVINILLLFLIVSALVVVGIWSRKKYESARLNAAKNPRRFSYVLAFVIVILEVITKLSEH